MRQVMRINAGCVCVCLCMMACLNMVFTGCRQTKTIIPRQYPLTFEFRPGLNDLPTPDAKIAHAHIGQWAGEDVIRRMPTKQPDIFRYGTDTILKVHRSFNHKLPDPFVVVRKCEDKGPEFRPDDNWFRRFSWLTPKEFQDELLLLFDAEDQLMNLVPLEMHSGRSVIDNNKSIPVEIYLRRLGMALASADEPPFSIILSAGEQGGGEIKITLTNCGREERTIFWPLSFEHNMASEAAYLDVYNQTTDLWEDLKKTTPFEAVKKEDFRSFGPGESASYVLPGLSQFYNRIPPDGEYTVRLHLPVRVAAYPVPGDDDPVRGDSAAKMNLVEAWTGYLMSNEIKYKQP